MSKFEKFYRRVVANLLLQGTKLRDVRLNRRTRIFVAKTLKISKKILNELKNEIVLEKYHADYERMKPTLDLAIAKAKQDIGSRQLVVLNIDDFENTLQCFQLMQFVFDGFKFTCCVYQRSGDMSKFKDDLIFFSKIIRLFEEDLMFKVESLYITYGNLHIESKN